MRPFLCQRKPIPRFLTLLVPKVVIEMRRYRVPLDFWSRPYASLTTPARIGFIHSIWKTGSGCQYGKKPPTGSNILTLIRSIYPLRQALPILRSPVVIVNSTKMLLDSLRAPKCYSGIPSGRKSLVSQITCDAVGNVHDII
jgi:hypothetical protein